MQLKFKLRVLASHKGFTGPKILCTTSNLYNSFCVSTWSTMTMISGSDKWSSCRYYCSLPYHISLKKENGEVMNQSNNLLRNGSHARTSKTIVYGYWTSWYLDRIEMTRTYPYHLNMVGNGWVILVITMNRIFSSEARTFMITCRKNRFTGRPSSLLFSYKKKEKIIVNTYFFN